MDKVQEYYNSSVGYVTIWGEIKDDPDMVVVTNGNDYGELSVMRRSDLVKKEDSYTYKREQERADELRLVTAKAEENFEKITEKVIKAACSTLKTRMKMNILFGKGGGGGWAVAVADELDKLVKEEASQIIKDEK